MSILRQFFGGQDTMPSIYSNQSIQDITRLGQYPNSPGSVGGMMPTPTPAATRAKTQLTIEPVANGYIVRVVQQSDILAIYVATDADSLSNVVNLALVSHKVSEALK